MLRVIVFWALLPFVLPQAFHLRKNAPRVTAAGGSGKGSAGHGDGLRLVAIGDSIIAGVGAATLDKALVGQTARQLSDLLDSRIDWHAFGSIGADTQKVIKRLLPDLPDQGADFVLLSVGVNDLTSLSSVSHWMDKLDELLLALREYAPGAIIAVAGIPPLRAFPLLPQPMRALFGLRGVTFDIYCRRVISGHRGVVHIPLDFQPEADEFSADGFHPSEAGYQLFGRMAAEHIASEYKASRWHMN